MSDIYTFPYILQTNHSSVFVKIVQPKEPCIEKKGVLCLYWRMAIRIGMLSGGG
ncbi:hypothetical protein [Brevibacillus laterosporus]|uniref:hypothetical protein n=1 Tax=Brevibacillus laterosporus TaxID=1465 RepID=UPI002655346B|nr:hypothetical protein [Brevibacillus laterosporus]MDN9012719.1 hypothetical protein [Brevibacillus laterosporus]MDO0943808.1 hypothetical protein [Brevibacillus laterosporus]